MEQQNSRGMDNYNTVHPEQYITRTCDVHVEYSNMNIEYRVQMPVFNK